MSRRGLLLIIDGEGRRSHGWSAGSPRTLHLRFQQASPLVKNLISIRSRSRFRGRSEMSTRCCGGPQVVWQKKFGPIGVSGSPRRFDQKVTALVGRRRRPQTASHPAVGGAQIRVPGSMTGTGNGRGTTLSDCLLYTSPSPRDRQKSRMPSSA